MYMGFFLTAIWRCWLLLQRTKNDADAWFADSARMTIASLCGYMVAAQFVSLEALEIPYYVVLLGAGSMTVHYRLTNSIGQSSSTAFANMETASSSEPELLETAYRYDTEAQEEKFIDETPFCETTAAPDYATTQAADWRDTIDELPQQVQGVERPSIMN